MAEDMEVMEGDSSPSRLGRRDPPAEVRAATGPELLEGVAVLKEACAVLAETEAVGGPDTKIDRKGGSNELVGACAVSP